MFDGGNGVIEHHSRTCPTHHFAYALPHLGPVAMDGAFLTSGLVIAELAMPEPCIGILQQLRARRTQILVPLLPPAIEPYHLLHHLLFFRYPAHHFCFVFYHSMGSWPVEVR